jgi:type IV secretion system protein VirD4
MLKDHGFNPMAGLDRSDPQFADRVEAIADALVIPSGDTRNGRFFDDSARSLLRMLTGWCCVVGGQQVQHLGAVRRLLFQPFGSGADRKPVGLTKLCMDIASYPAFGGEFGPCPEWIKEDARSFIGGGVSDSLRDVVRTAQEHMAFMAGDVMRESLRTQRVLDFRRMRDEIMTVYIILPLAEMGGKARWMRLVVATALAQLYENTRGERDPVLFMLDEFANLGRMEIIARALGQAAGLGVQLWPFVQDLNQLKELYANRYESFVGSTGALSVLGPVGDKFTADYTAKLFGERSLGVFYDHLMRMRFKEAVTRVNVPGLEGVPIRTYLPHYYETRFAEGLTRSPLEPRGS